MKIEEIRGLAKANGVKFNNEMILAIKIAEATEKVVINKVSEWLEENLLKYWGQINANDTEEFIEELKQAMEEEK